MATEISDTAALGCIVCRLQFDLYSPAEIHHLRENTGLSLRSNKIIPLCPIHHRLGMHGIAFHAGKSAFEANFGTQLELWQKTQELLKQRATGR